MGHEDSPTETPSEEETQEVTGHLGAQKQVSEGHGAQDLLMVVVPEDSSPLLLVPRLSQDLGAEVHLKLDLSFLDISDIVNHTDNGA